MDYVRQQDVSCLTFRFNGRLTFRDSAAFEAVTGEIAASSVPWIRFDLSGLEYLDSYGIGLFALARDAAEQAGARLELVNVKGPVADVLYRISFDCIVSTPQIGDLRISTMRRTGAEARVALAGNFRVTDQERFLPIIQSAISDDFSRLIIDLGQLTFIDSIGISLIMTAADEARKVGKEVMLGNPQGSVRDLLRLTAVDTVVQVV
ncbi:STAS domain-containing protein [Magnetospirillum gryphiswaldense]|uniref:Anti-sigma-factor antagonist n=2 Tax=Magnetospirillum gryphiswaldense TaxID=55518 RepID=V6EYV2_MAGGM|nr:STAS domain-containing protein [Magnetospirillum gryphiswaldense]AVM74500.1 STAS domain protein [Magnetospirillum gryphiswaldense MSR-1]AVM78403.1 STAS domain protein [Magnetospirillum gryphiswaldense]CAM75447.1 hypothetical protein MGR_2410 [Magnetospirillum gryphiswaldense MSR-1]CDK97403.1 putative anti-sigma-factor antagonist [Magnetospirillum gryphiswaldense MSR-1 v2]